MTPSITGGQGGIDAGSSASMGGDTVNNTNESIFQSINVNGGVSPALMNSIGGLSAGFYSAVNKRADAGQAGSLLIWAAIAAIGAGVLYIAKKG